MKKEELIAVLKKQVENARRLSEEFKGDEDQITYDCEAWTLQDVINMLENEKYYEARKAVLFKEGK